MDKLAEYIMQINCLNYNNQCKYIKIKLLFIGIYDTRHIMFFKKLQAMLQKLPVYVKEIDVNINEEANSLFKFLCELDDRSYFKDSVYVYC